MTDQEHAAVLRRSHKRASKEGDHEEMAAIERAIVLLEREALKQLAAEVPPYLKTDHLRGKFG